MRLSVRHVYRRLDVSATSAGRAEGRLGTLAGPFSRGASLLSDGAERAEGDRSGDTCLTPHASFDDICRMEDNLIPLADLVSVFHRSKSTLYRWADSGQIPTRKIGSTVYMHRDDVARYTSNRGRIDVELERRRETHGRILDAETTTLIISTLEDALVALRLARRSDK